MPVSLKPLVLAAFAIVAMSLAGCQRNGAQFNEAGVFRVVSLKVTPTGLEIGNGTAFKVHGTSSVVTNQHVIENAESIALVYWEGSEFKATEVRVVTADPKRDIALLRAIRPLPGEPFPLASYVPASGGEAWAIGYPSAADSLFSGARTIDQYITKLTKDPAMSVATRTSGSISSERKLDNVQYIQHQVPISPGNSGGPLIDACGNVVGMNTFLAKNANSIFGAVRSTEIIETMRLYSMPVVPVGSRCLTILEPRNQVYAIAGIAVIGLGLAGLAVVAAFAFRRGRVPLRPVGGSRGAGIDNNNGRNDRVIEIEPLPLNIPSAELRQELPIAPAHAPAQNQPGAQPVAVLVGSGAQPIRHQLAFKPTTQMLVVGRDPACDIVIEDVTVSRRHCQISPAGNARIRVVDLGSGNGTRLNGHKIANAVVRAGDTLAIGSVEFRLGSAPAHAGQTAEGGTWTLTAMDEQGRPSQFILDAAGPKRAWNLGRSKTACDFVINSPTVSAQHAAIRLGSGNRWEVQDKGSSNGTFVEGVRIGSEWTPLDVASRLTLGRCELRLQRN